MKKLVLLLILVHTAGFAFSQNNKWFFSLGTNKNIGGPTGSFKRQIREQGFNQRSEDIVIFLDFKQDYPAVTKTPNLMVHAGKKLTDKKSLYIGMGIADITKVEGYRREDYFNWGIIGGTTGKSVSVASTLYQASVGYMYCGNTRAKWGVAPSLFLLNYSIQNDSLVSKSSAVTCGATITGRFPLGKQKKLVGVDLFAELNLAPPVKLHSNQTDAKDFKPTTANLVYGSVGLALSFRR